MAEIEQVGADKERLRAYARERRSQMRGLLLLAAGALGLILWRARPLVLFHAGWWRP